MYYSNDPESEAQLKNERLLQMISESPMEGVESDDEARAAFEESLRHLAEDILEYSPGLAHILLAMTDGNDPFDSVHGQN